MSCDFKNCGLCINGKCTDEKEYSKCMFVRNKEEIERINGLLAKMYLTIGKWME